MAKTTKLRQKPHNPKQFRRLMFEEGKIKQIFSHKYFRLPSFKSLLLCNVQIDAFVTIAKIMIDRNTRKYLHHLGSRLDKDIKIAITHKVIVRMVPGQS